MANPEHLEILRQGVEMWNKWRMKSNYIQPLPELSNADLQASNLVSFDLTMSNLSGANLHATILIRANLRGANLQGANLSNAIMNVVDMTSASLYSANMTSAILGGTTFADTDLTNASGLDSCHHMSSSTIDHRTLAKSGKLPLNFLRGCGLPDTLIEYIPSMLNNSIQFHSCFISYSSKDQGFANNLYADLQSRGVRCWLASEDLEIGAEIRTGIDDSIRVHDKLLLVLSDTSVKSQWVQQEVETALAKEREQGRTVLFPIRLDDTVMQINTGWPAYLKNTRNIGDFTRWKDHDSYQKAFDRLLRDLKAEGK